MISVDDLNPFYTKEAGKYEPKSSKHIITVEKTSIPTNNALQNSEPNKIEEIIASTDEVIMVEKIFLQVRYLQQHQKKCLIDKQYIVGCFAVKENAFNYKNKIEGDGFSPQLASQVTYIEFQWV